MVHAGAGAAVMPGAIHAAAAGKALAGAGIDSSTYLFIAFIAL